MRKLPIESGAATLVLSTLVLAQVACTSPQRVTSDVPPADVRAPDTYQVHMETSRGPVVIDVNRAWAPKGADRFYMLTKRGFYDQARFFRVMPGFVVQFGLHANPEETAKWAGAELQDDPVAQPNVKGTVSFAHHGANSRTTQVFINLGNNSNSLDPQGFSVFGRVSQGMDKVEQLYSGYGAAAQEKQEMITLQGNKFLLENFPKLDFIQKATVTE
jgi:peptidyl-prolyl cis-trans isomerase A (cyclophilin A)